VAASIANANGTTAFPAEYFVRAGWTVGGGIEVAITGNWSAKFEYPYVGLEDYGYFVPTPNNSYHITHHQLGWRSAARQQYRSRRHKLRSIGYSLPESLPCSGVSFRVSHMD
jgi:hypothetical protein